MLVCCFWQPQAIHSAEAVADDVDDEELLSVFRSFATFGAGAAAAATPPGKPVELDGPRFAKLCRETGVQVSGFEQSRTVRS